MHREAAVLRRETKLRTVCRTFFQDPIQAKQRRQEHEDDDQDLPGGERFLFTSLARREQH